MENSINKKNLLSFQLLSPHAITNKFNLSIGGRLEIDSGGVGGSAARLREVHRPRDRERGLRRHVPPGCRGPRGPRERGPVGARQLDLLGTYIYNMRAK